MTTQLLTGIPGTGKTHHLTERALRYLADGNDPARLLILAPTRTAATRMRDTIAASSDRSLSVAPTRAWAAYAFDLLKRAQTRGLLSGVEGNLKLLSGPEQDVIIGELLANHAEGIAPGPAWPDVLRDALATRGFRHEIRDFFDRMAEYDLTAEDVHALATEHNQPAWHALAQLHTEYRAVRALRAKNAYDPAVLINDACRLLLRAPEFLAEERRRYDLILIDDVQELSPSIYRLLRLIAAEVAPADAAHLTETHPDLFAEGPQVVMTYSDEAVVQGFRGARPDLVTTLQASFPSMRTRTLTTSYRLPALMMPLVADIRRRLPRYTRFVPLTAEQEGGAQEGEKNGAPATFGRINTQRCKTARQTRQKRHQQACCKPADAHCRQAQPGKHITDCRAGQDGMAQSIAYQAHAPHDQEHADRSGTQSQTEYRRKRIAHKVEFRKRGNQQIV